MIGVDIVAISRISAFREKFGAKALERFLNQDEISLAKNDSSLAGFWAAKEAVSKALGCGIGKTCGFEDIVIFKDLKGKPYLKLSPRLVEEFQISSTSLSIAHDGGFAIAVVVIESSASNKL